MNFGTFQGAGTGALGGSITRYTQTGAITSSQTIGVLSGVQRIEALVAGGGGGGGGGQPGGSANGAGGGFGNAAIMEIPITGSPLQVVIGAGGAGALNTPLTASGNGSPTYIVSAGTRYAEVGGGGRGCRPRRAWGSGSSRSRPSGAR